MLRKLLNFFFGWNDAEESKGERMWRGIVVRSDGSAYRTDESINEMVRDYLATQRHVPTPSGEQK